MSLLILGASARAAAFSALRAGLIPRCADLFADQDLLARAPVARIPGPDYPDAFLALSDQDEPGPWLYTGALENRAGLVDRLARRRPLWGNPGPVLRRVRDPFLLAESLTRAGLPTPEVRPAADPPPADGSWLLKRRASAGGAGIARWHSAVIPPAGSYFQRFLDGPSLAAAYVADGATASLLGVTRQLTGEPWLHAAPFHYAGSLGPWPVAPAVRDQLRRLGDTLARAFGLRGLFGVDGILHAGSFVPVEVNPRYTASLEVLEHAAGESLLARHRQAFEPTAPPVAIAPPLEGVVAKAILFARSPLAFPARGPWRAALDAPSPITALPAYADIPAPGEPIAAGQPILTFFAHAATPDAALAALRDRAARLDAVLAPAYCPAFTS